MKNGGAAGKDPLRVISDKPALQSVHAGLLCALFALPLFIAFFRPWPFYLLVPLTAYAAIVAVVPPLRRGVCWLRVGRLDGAALAWVAGFVVISSAGLAAWFTLAHPKVNDLADQIPRASPFSLVLIGAGFSVLNALMEEAAFRGVLQEALTAEWDPRLGIVVQGVVFGVIHAQGFPRGPEGIFLASIYGVALGWLRKWSGGMAAVCIAHICADATIFALLVVRPGA